MIMICTVTVRAWHGRRSHGENGETRAVCTRLAEFRIKKSLAVAALFLANACLNLIKRTVTLAMGCVNIITCIRTV